MTISDCSDHAAPTTTLKEVLIAVKYKHKPTRRRTPTAGGRIMWLRCKQSTRCTDVGWIARTPDDVRVEASAEMSTRNTCTISYLARGPCINSIYWADPYLAVAMNFRSQLASCGKHPHSVSSFYRDRSPRDTVEVNFVLSRWPRLAESVM